VIEAILTNMVVGFTLNQPIHNEELKIFGDAKMMLSRYYSGPRFFCVIIER